MTGKALEPVEDATAIIMGEVVPEVEGSEGAQRMIAAQILSETTLAGLFRDIDTVGTKDVVGLPLVITDCHLMRSNLEGARGTYLIVDAVKRETGEPLTLNTSAVRVMTQVYHAKRLGVMPIDCSVQEARAAAPGREPPLKLVAEGRTLKAIEEVEAKG